VSFGSKAEQLAVGVECPTPTRFDNRESVFVRTVDQLLVNLPARLVTVYHSRRTAMEIDSDHLDWSRGT
jgi:hypothetical protein